MNQQKYGLVSDELLTIWPMENIIIFVVGLGVGAGVSFFIISGRFRAKLLQAQVSGLENSKEVELLEQQVQNTEKQVSFYQQQYQELKTQQAELEKKMTQQFENLAHRIFDEKTTKWSDLSQKSLTSLLDPLKERLKDFEKKVEDTYSTERSERGMLRGEIQKLFELNQEMSSEAQNLTRALKGENKTQGNWGEMILENILERSGLRAGEEYTLQGSEMSLKDEEGSRALPDVIINLPGGKHIIIDSKMTLKAYEAASSADNEEDRLRNEKLHVKSLEDHIQGLSQKKYHDLEKLITPDFVILFMPLEPAFSKAFQLKPDIFNWAWEKNIAVVSPTTLLTTLRTVAALWKQERQQKNALEIAKRGGLLYDKFAGLLKDFNDLGIKLNDAQKFHSEIVSKIQTGRGNLMSQAEELKEMGVKTQKSLPELQG